MGLSEEQQTRLARAFGNPGILCVSESMGYREYPQFFYGRCTGESRADQASNWRATDFRQNHVVLRGRAPFSGLQTWWVTPRPFLIPSAGMLGTGLWSNEQKGSSGKPCARQNSFLWPLSWRSCRDLWGTVAKVSRLAMIFTLGTLCSFQQGSAPLSSLFARGLSHPAHRSCSHCSSRRERYITPLSLRVPAVSQ